MSRFGLKHSRLIALFFLGCVLFNYPILSLVNQQRIIFGIPLLYLCLFAAWLIFILLIFWATTFRARASAEKTPTGGRSD